MKDESGKLRVHERLLLSLMVQQSKGIRCRSRLMNGKGDGHYLRPHANRSREIGADLYEQRLG